MIYALALGTNIDHAAALRQVQAALALLGHCEYSPVYELPDRVGRAHLMYWNQAVLLTVCELERAALLEALDRIERHCGRVRPSQYVRMDIDLIAAGDQVSTLEVVTERLPLPADVYLPMATLWPDCPRSVATSAQHSHSLNIRHPILHTDDALRQPLHIDEVKL